LRVKTELCKSREKRFCYGNKIRDNNEFFVASTKNFAAATKRFVDRTKHFVVVSNYFCYPSLTTDFAGITKPFFRDKIKNAWDKRNLLAAPPSQGASRIKELNQ